MTTKLKNSLRALLLIIPLLFVLVTVASQCSGGGECDGDVGGVTNEQDCLSYADANACDSSNFTNGVCNVFGCDNCEVIVDDDDPVTDDIEDDGFFF